LERSKQLLIKNYEVAKDKQHRRSDTLIIINERICRKSLTIKSLANLCSMFQNLRINLSIDNFVIWNHLYSKIETVLLEELLRC